MNQRNFPTDQPELVQISRKLAESNGPQFWRSLEELSGTEAFQGISIVSSPRSRRSGPTQSVVASSSA